MDRPKVIVNVRFEDKESPTERLVNEQFEFELVGSHIHVRPLVSPETKDKKTSPSRKKVEEDETPKKTNPKKPGAIRNAHLDEQKNEDQPVNKQVPRENSKKTLPSPKRHLSPKSEGSKGRNKSPEDSSHKPTHPRNTPRREDYDVSQKNLGPKCVAEISSWSIGVAGSSKLPNSTTGECGQINYCVRKEEEGTKDIESESQDIESSDDTDIDDCIRRKKCKNIHSKRCDTGCFIEDEEEPYTTRRVYNRGAPEGKHHKRKRNPYGSYEEMLEESVKQFPAHPRAIYDKKKTGRSHDNRHRKNKNKMDSDDSIDERGYEGKHRNNKSNKDSDESIEERRNGDKRRKRKHKKHSDESIDVNQKQKHKHIRRELQDKSSTKTKTNRTQNVEDTSSNTSVTGSSESSDTEDDRTKEYSKHHKKKQDLKNSQRPKHKKINNKDNRTPKNRRNSDESIKDDRKKQTKEDEKQKKGSDEDGTRLPLTEESQPICPWITCSIRCCSKMAKLEDLKNPTKIETNKSAVSLLDMGVRSKEEK